MKTASSLRSITVFSVLALGLAITSNVPSHAADSPPRLKVGENQRFLVYEDGRPFFYLGDTAWKLFHRLTREEADRYLENRAKKGFTVIQAVAIAELMAGRKQCTGITPEV